jgi:hypothetical protein
MSNIYSLTNEYENLYNQLLQSANDETGEVDSELLNFLQVKEEEFDSKAISIATISRKFENNISEIKAEIDRLTEIKKRVEKIKTRLDSVLSDSCQRLGKVRIDGLHANISFRLSEQTIIDDETKLTDEFLIIKTTKAPDKTKIKNAIKSGIEIDGAHIEQKNNIQIK